MSIETAPGRDPGRAPAGLNGLLSRRVKEFRIREALREIDQARSVLDLGCGLCEIVPRLDDAVRYVGVEREPWMLERARRLFPSRSFLGSDLEDRSLDPSGPFDAILLLAVWEHLADPGALLGRAREWVTAGGRFVLTTPSPRSAAILDAGSRLGLLSRHADEEHERLWSIAEIGEVARAHGWRLRHARGFLFGLNQLVVLERDESKGAGR